MKYDLWVKSNYYRILVRQNQVVRLLAWSFYNPFTLNDLVQPGKIDQTNICSQLIELMRMFTLPGDKLLPGLRPAAATARWSATQWTKLPNERLHTTRFLVLECSLLRVVLSYFVYRAHSLNYLVITVLFLQPSLNYEGDCS